METSFETTKQILNTLPIGYYCGRKIDVELSESNSSYFDPMNDKIVIGYELFKIAFDKIETSEFEEELVRTMLYHEISHTILTPKALEMTRIVNVFEDERIETILKNFFINVNFKKLVKLIANDDGSKPKTADNMFYQVVRFRRGPEELVKEVSQIIKDYKTINVNDWYWSQLNNYTYRINELYKNCKKYFEEKQNEEIQNAKKENSDNIKTEENGNDFESKSEVEENEETQELNQTSSNEDTENKDTEEFTFEETKVLFDKATNVYKNTSIQNELYIILSKIAFQTSRNASAINAYSGKLDIRSMARDDYKYFVRDNRNGNVKRFSKFHLNLFIDCSGSYRDNDLLTNQILYGLKEIEKLNNDFTFDLVECGYGQKVKDKTERIHKSYGGNYLHPEIYEQFKSLQHSDSDNYNIVLFDGDAYSDAYGKDKTTFKAFDKTNCFIISDYSNKRYIDKHCKSAKVIYSNNYTEELFEAVKNSLLRMTR